MTKEYKEKEEIIINNYGIDNQLKYLQSEVFELNEAVIIFENEEYKYMEEVANYELGHIAEEMADVLVMLKQIQLYYEITDKQIEDIMKYKIDRQIDRLYKIDRQTEEIKESDK